jgi:hypothetical protein
MTRCKEFFDRWEKEENWCEKCRSSVSEINSYLTLVKGLEKRGIQKTFAFANFSEGAARPIFREGDSDVQDGAFDTLVERLELQQERQKLGHVPDKITAKEVTKMVQEARSGKTLKEPKPKRIEEQKIERVPLWSVTSWLMSHAKEYIGVGGLEVEMLVEDLEEEMRKRHLGRDNK